MARIIIWIASTIASLVLLFGYSTSTLGPAPSAQAGPAIPGLEAAATPTPVDAGSGSTATPGSDAPSESTPKPDPVKTYTGDSISTEYGPVQVQISTKGGEVTDVKVLQVPWSNGEDREINGRAVPELNAQVVDGNPSDVQTVSGASYTSPAYIDSLQSALDQANL